MNEEKRNKIEEMQAKGYDWYICKECGGVGFAEAGNKFINIVAKRGKKCVDCVSEMEIRRKRGNGGSI